MTASPVALSALHGFFKEISLSADYACLLGGAVAPTALNQWAIIGLHARQTLLLEANWLSVNGQREQLTGPDGAARLFAVLESARNQAQSWPASKKANGLPMAGGLMGAVGYGFYRWCDPGWQSKFNQADPTDAAPQNADSKDWPALVLCEFQDWLFIHLESGALTVLTEAADREAAYRQAWQRANQPPAMETPWLPGCNEDLLSASWETFDASFSASGFAEKVEKLKADIRAGEVYQANLSLRLQKTLHLDPYALFERLCRRNPSPFSGFFQWPGGVIVSNSPERLVQLDERRVAQTRPIAGTRGRGQTPAEDAAIGQSLLHNEKERAEHLMLVDLARNDLGRVCAPGSVRVDDLLVLERYSHVTHLVSNVTGQLQPQATGWDLLRALFPGGTITGCPKIRCVEILNGVEPVSRGFYTGSLGYVDAASSAMDWNILIRSLFLRPEPEVQPTGRHLRYNTAVHVGAGIVHDAVGGQEYRECRRKAAASLHALMGLESPLPVAPTDQCTVQPAEGVP